jgi:class 3 adenylate cyclase
VCAVGSDYDGLVLQHWGDCILAILHLPCGDDEHTKRCRKELDIAIGLQSSMEHALNQHLTDRKEIHVAVGLDVGKAFVTRLGKKGRRVTITFGPEVLNAERLQMRTGPKGIRISEAIYEQLDDEDMENEFSEDGGSYVATGLTFPMLDRLKEEKAARAGTLGSAVREGRVALTPWPRHRPGRGTTAGRGAWIDMHWHERSPQRWEA